MTLKLVPRPSIPNTPNLLTRAENTRIQNRIELSELLVAQLADGDITDEDIARIDQTLAILREMEGIERAIVAIGYIRADDPILGRVQ